MYRPKVVAIATILLMETTVLAGCATQPPRTAAEAREQESSSCSMLGPKATTGMLAGAALGAGAGLAATHNNGNALAGAIVGGLLGAIVGGSVGSHLDQSDCEQAHAALQQFESAKTGENLAWSNPSTGTRGTLTATADASEMNGKVCRPYTLKVQKPDNQEITDSGITCRDPVTHNWERMTS